MLNKFQQRLVEQNMDFARKIAFANYRKFKQYLTLDECLSGAYYGLVDAIANYENKDKISKKVSNWEGYLHLYCRNRIYKDLHSRRIISFRTRKRKSKVKEPIIEYDGKEKLKLSNISDKNYDEIVEQEKYDHLVNTINKLPDIEKTIINHKLTGRKYKEIASLMKISERSLYRLMSNTQDNLKKLLE